MVASPPPGAGDTTSTPGAWMSTHSPYGPRHMSVSAGAQVPVAGRVHAVVPVQSVPQPAGARDPADPAAAGRDTGGRGALDPRGADCGLSGSARRPWVAARVGEVHQSPFVVAERTHVTDFPGPRRRQGQSAFSNEAPMLFPLGRRVPVRKIRDRHHRSAAGYHPGQGGDRAAAGGESLGGHRLEGIVLRQALVVCGQPVRGCHRSSCAGSMLLSHTSVPPIRPGLSRVARAGASSMSAASSR